MFNNTYLYRYLQNHHIFSTGNSYTAAGPVSRGVSPGVSCHLCGTQFRQLRVRALTVVGCWWMMSSGVILDSHYWNYGIFHNTMAKG